MEGDRLEAFDEARPLLFSIAYRMLGSVADAEDVVQEAFLRWQKADAEDVRSPKAYLSTVTTRLAIDHLRSARVAREEYVGPWLPEPIATDPESDPAGHVAMAESLSIAFLVLLERLSATERAVFLLREVFNYEYDEIARIVGKSEANCRQVLKRAREHVAEHRARFEASTEQRERLLHLFAKASGEGDMQGLLSVLAEDVVLQTDGGGRVQAAINPIYGADRVARFFLGILSKLAPESARLRFTDINGQPGFLLYVDGTLDSAFTCDVAGDRIQNIYIVRNPEKLGAMPRHPLA